MSTPPATSARVNASEGTVSSGTLVGSSPSVSELRGRAVRELGWLGETSVVRQGRTRGEQRQLDLDLAC